MKNIFSKTTENRTQNGVKSYSFPTRLLYTISIFTFLTIGVGQMWAADDTLENSSHIYFCNKDCGNFKSYDAVPKLNLHDKNTNNWTLICGTSLGNDYWDFVIPSSGDYDKVQIGRYSTNGDNWDCWSNILNVSARPSNSHNYLHMTEKNYWEQTLTWRTWTIAGNNPDLLGSRWAFDASSNDMKFDPATQTFSLTKTFTSSSSLSIEYKAGMDHATGTTIGNNNNNKSFTINYPGTYAITFTLNAAQNAVTEVVKRQFCDTELSSTGGPSSTINLSCYIVDSKYRIVIKGTGLTGISEGVYFKYGGTGEVRQLKTYATPVSNTSTNITYDIPGNALPPLFFTKLFVLYPAGESQFAQIENQEIDWEHSCEVTYYSVTYDGSDATDGSAPVDASNYLLRDLVTVAAKPDGLIKTNYIFSGWNTAPDMTGTTYVAAATFPISSNTTLYAKWAQGIVLNANKGHHGTGENKNVTAIWNKAALEDNFSATTGEKGYTLDGYYTTAVGGTKVLNADGSFADQNVSGYITGGKWRHTGSTPTLYAHWVADTWILKSTDTKLGDFVNTGTDEYRLNINITDDNKNNWHFFRNSTIEYHYGAVNPLNEDVTLTQGSGQLEWKGGSNGHYTLKIWKDGNTWKYRAYASPQINFTASPSNSSVSASSNWEDAIAAGSYVMYGSDVTFTATPASHYTLEGWYSVSDFSGDNLGTTNPLTVSNVTSNTARYAKFALEQYTIKLDINESHHGTIDGKTTSQVVDYRGATTTVTDLPTGADGYKFMGFYTGAEGAGTQVINADGTWIASVDGYTDEDKKWIHDADATLYAYYQAATITSLALPGGSLYTVGGSAFTAAASVSAFDGNALVCWQVKNDREEEVSTTFTPASGNKVTVSIPSTPGRYKVVASLKAGTTCNGDVLHTAQQSFTVEGHYTVTITNGTGSSFVGEETTATVTANPAAEGKKFDHWEVTGTITKYTSGDANSRVITFNASSNITLTAVYTDRDSKTVYFAKPSGWTDGLKVYAWEEATKDGGGNPSNKNANWPGVECTSTTKEKGTTYYFYTYYTDDNGEGDDKTAQERWDKIIFNDNGNNSEKTADLTLVGGHFYHVADGSGGNGRDIATVSGSASAEDWYVCGYWDQSTDDWGFAHPVDLNGSTSGSVVVTVRASLTQEFKIFRASTNEWFKWTGGPNEDYRNNYAALIGDPMTLRIYDLNRNTFTSYAREYRFTLDITSPSNPVLTLTPNDNTPYSATLSKNGNGSLSVGTGAITLHQYIPTTITATPEPGYRFTGWTTTGSVAFADGTSSSNATASFTATDNGGTITANFSNSEVIYFDASGVSDRWGNKVYVTFFSNNFAWNDGNGKDGALIVKDWVNNALYCVEMTRIPNTDIYYLDYSNLSGHESVTKYVLFTSKPFVRGEGNNYYRLYDMAAVTRGDYAKNTTNNLFVAEDWLEKDKNKTGYYVGYWMNYKQTDPGVYLDIHDGGSLLPDIPNFQLIDGSENEYTATYTLSGNNTYKLGLRGANGTYYNNDRSGTMTFSNCTGWSYVDRQKTPGGISTTADGEYKFTLTCGDKLTLSVEYPLSVGDYRIIYQGALEDTTSAPRHDHPSKIIRQLSGDATERKDTVSFFVTGDWSITLQKCTSVIPDIAWENACGSATKDAEALGLSGKTGVYVFPLTLSSTVGDGDQITVGTPELYTGDYYIRTDVAKGGWEGYTRSLDNRMTYSDYAKHNSGFDYYNCQYAQTNKNVKFTIANDYSFCITDTLEGDAYVPKAGANIGKLPYQANIRFMYNSAKNTISRAYLNGSSETGENTFLYLQSTSNASEPDIYQSDGSELVDNTIRFNDHNNWIYQIDIQANEQARVKLISNYRFNSTDHLQYFKGTDGDWSEATTSEIIGGDYSSHPNERHALRIIYDFKTNHLLSAWLVPESGSVPAAAINTNVMIIKQNQEDARQITFSSGNDALTEVDTVYTAVLLTKDFLTGGVASEYAKQFYWVSFPYTVQINDIFGSVGTYGYDWILQRYNGKKRAANGFWIDSEPNWEFMDKSETLNPYEGYILTLDLSEFTTASNKWGNSVTTLSLYFPSDSKVGNIKQKDVTVEYDQTGYACTITRDNRNIKDSYWRCIGSPSFAENTIGGWNRHENTDDTWKTENLPFLYEWNSATNQLSPVAAGGNYTFKPLTGYMVQYSGASLNWTNVVTPSVSAPKRQNSAATDLTYKLQLVRGEEEVDHTFVRFSDDENITAAFEFNQDLSKEFKSGANIYTLTSDQIQVAGNSLPLSTTQTTVVPVGVKIKSAGDYTFSIPEGTDGIGVTLVDNETGVRTLLSALDYTVNLAAGDYTERFWLEISPIYNTPTGIEDPTSDSSLKGRAQKRIIDGVLYIVKDGKIFDARGTRVE